MGKSGNCPGPNSCIAMFKIHIMDRAKSLNVNKLKGSCQNLVKILKNTCPGPYSCMIMIRFSISYDLAGFLPRILTIP
jgi:hypothetical protein